MINQSNACHVLMNEFEAMKKAYDNDEDGYDDLAHSFYDEKFVPYIVKQLNENNETELKKIFALVERLFNEGDEYAVNVADVSIVESLYYEKEYEGKYKEKIFSLCGNLTRKSFDRMDEDDSAVDDAANYKESIAA